MRLKVLLPVSLQHSAAVFDCTMWRRGSKGLPSGDGKESNISSKIEQSNLVLFSSFYVFNVHYPSSCHSFYLLFEILFGGTSPWRLLFF